jgi:hypothetical protein
MSITYNVTFGSLTESDRKCLEYTVSSIDAWVDGIIKSQIDFAKIGIINALKEYCFATGTIAADTDDGKILQAFELGLVKTAEQIMLEEQTQE